MPTPQIIGLDVNGQNICGVNTTTKSIFETTTTEPVIPIESLVSRLFRSGAKRTSSTNSSKETTENKNESEQGSDEVLIESLKVGDGGMRSEENFENFDFTELDIRIEGKLKENDEVFDAYVYLFDDVKISIKTLLEERYNRKFKDMKFIEVQRNEYTNEISNIFISFGKADKVPLVEFLSKKYFSPNKFFKL